MFFENHIQVFEARTEERVQSNLKKVNQLRSKFFEVTEALWSYWQPLFIFGMCFCFGASDKKPQASAN